MARSKGMLRALWYVPAAGVWSLLTLTLAILAGVLTFGRFSHRLINVFAPLWARGLLRIFGVRLRVIGREHIAEPGARLLVVNHTSLIDMLSLSAINPPHAMALGKKQFFWIPFLGQAWWALGQAFIDRSNRERAIASFNRVAEKLHDPPRSVVVFPEGTRSRDGELQPFKMGAFHLALQARIPIVPMVIYGAFGLVPPDSWQIMPGEVVVVIHPPRSTAHWTRESLRSEANALHAEYEAWVKETPPAPESRDPGTS